MGYGIGGHLGIARQNSFGTASTSWDFVPIISESLVTNIEALISETIQGRYEEGASYPGLLTVTGDVVFEPDPIMMGHFLKGVTGMSSGTLATSATNWIFQPSQTDFDDTTALPPYSLQVYRSTGLAWFFQDAVINKLSVNIKAGSVVRATASIMARVSSLGAKSVASYLSGDPYRWNQASYSAAGAANGDLEDLTITIDNGVEGVTFLDGTLAHGKYKRTGYRKSTISGTMDFSTQSQYAVFRQSSRQPMVLTLTGDNIGGAAVNLLKFDMPEVRYSSFPIAMGGPGRVTVGFDGTLKYNASSACAIRMTMTNTRTSY